MEDSKNLSAWKCFTLRLCLCSMIVVVSGDLGAKYKRWTPATYPNPQQDVLLCGRGVKSSICDPENILDLEAANMVDGLINEIAEGQAPFKKAQCGEEGLQGFQVAVALMHRMEVSKPGDKAAAAKAFARSVHDTWGVGNSACQNGVLLLLAIGDRQVYISTGRGVKAVVSDSQLTVVLDNIRPALKHKRYADAVLQAVQQIGLLLSGQTPEPPGVDEDDGWGIFTFFCATVAAVVGWSWFSNRRQSQRFKRCADKLAAIKRDQTAIRGRHYAASSCPICLEDFAVPVTAAAGSTGSTSTASAEAAAAAVGTSRSPAGEIDREVDDAPSAPLLGRGGSSQEAGSSSSAAAAAAAAGPTGASSSSSGGGTKKGPAGRKPLVLRCGHAFCDPCISQWLKHHTNCPICRKDLEEEDGDEQAPEAAAAASCAANNPVQVEPQDVLRQQVWLPELGFRLRRLRMLYPEFVTDPMVYAWEEDLATGRALNTGVVQQFEARNPARQQQLEQAGRSGASSSAYFGGGSSRGGGGAGGSW